MTDIKTSLSTTWDNIKTSTNTAWTNLKTSVTTTFEGLKATLSTKATDMKTSLIATWDNIKTTTSNTWSNIKTSVSSTFNDMKSTLTNTATDLKTAMSTTWTSIQTTATNAWTSTTSWISTKFTDLKTSLGKMDWTNIGSNVLTGLQNGISSGWSAVSSWVTSKFKSLVNSVKSVFGISSPSKVFTSIGEFLMGGLRIGMNGGSGPVLKTVSNIADAIVDGMANDTANLQVVGDASVSGLNNVITRLSDIASIFARITDMLSSIGGFKMPEIAAGTVIPYKARVSGGVANEQDSLASFTINFDETMSDQRGLLRELIELVRRLKLVVDGDSLAQAITSLQRSQLRSFGGV